MFSAVHLEVTRSPGAVCDIKFLRHCILNQLRSYSRKFRDIYGEMTVCLEGGHCWRRDFFPNYKAARAKARIDSGIDWKQVFKDLDQITQEFIEALPWKFVKVPGLEADDVVALLAKNAEKITQPTLMGDVEPVMIVSNDKDYTQLQKYKWVSQYLPRKGTILKEKHPENALLDLIVHGDKADGIPNINSQINSFVDGDRQKPVNRSLMENVLSCGTRLLNESQRKRFEENETLISFDRIPEQYEDIVLQAWKDSVPNRSKNKMFMYFASKGLKKQIERIDDF